VAILSKEGKMKKLLIIFVLIISTNSFAAIKLKNIAKVEGIRANQLIGYGLVVGLNGTGDKSRTEFTNQSLVNMLSRMGVTVNQDDVKVENVAAVMVTATLPPFAKAGSEMDVTISSIGDAESLEGGTLLLTPLKAPNGEVYAVAQGPITVGGMNVSAGGTNTTKNHPTVGRIPNGAIIEKEIPYQLKQTYITLNFNNMSISNIVEAKNRINTIFNEKIAEISSPGSLQIAIPGEFRNRYYEFLDEVLKVEIIPEDFAKVVVDERTGTIVMGSDVRVSAVAISHGNLTIKVNSTVNVNQPGAFSRGQTVITGETDVNIEEEEGKMMMLPEPVRISDLVKALNSIGVSPRDLIAILQSIKAAGALHGKLEVI
jgi:flagellar P-ring protein precursor FlgI